MSLQPPKAISISMSRQKDIQLKSNHKKNPDIWPLFIEKCLGRRIRGQQFDSLVEQLYEECPISGRKLADAVLDRQKYLTSMVDPLVLSYLESLLNANKINAADLLSGVFARARNRQASNSANGDSSGQKHTVKNSSDLEPIILEQLARQFLNGKRPRSPEEVRGTLMVLSEWMLVVSKPSESLMQALDQLDQNNTIVTDALGTLAIAMLENAKVIGVIDSACPKDLRKHLSASLSAFIGAWTQSRTPQQAQSVNRLALAQKQRAVLEEKPVEEPDKNVLDLEAALKLESTQDLLVVHTRAGLFVFLSSLLVGRPLTEDVLIMSYLQMNYKGSMQVDVENLTIDLIVASFDILSSAVARKESSQNIFCLKSFLINKIPSLLAALSSSMLPPTSSEYCIGQALGHIDQTAFPSVSFGMISESVLQDVRQEFLFSCVLHSQLRNESVEGLLGEAPFTSPPNPSSRYTKESLMEQCSTNSERASELVEEMEKLDGNAGAISQALAEIIRNQCANRDTIALKTICNSLSERPQSLDILLQFNNHINLLQPICQLLDSWRYEDDQGEYQPVYDEFASVFLLVLAFVYRYDMSYLDLGIARDSFVAKYLAQGHKSIPAEDLTEEQTKNLATWIKGLFNTDSFTDEVLSCCQPQQFYLLVPTLFSQIIMACTTGLLDRDAIKTPLEYLLEPFLLPSLVGAIQWMTGHAWRQDHQDLNTLMGVFQRVITTPGGSQSMHGTVLSIIAHPLSRYLRKFARRKQAPPVFEQLLSALKPHLEFRRTAYYPREDLASWLSSPGSLKQSVHSMFQSLILWSTSATINPVQGPPSYCHRQMIIAQLLLGAPCVLSVILNEIRSRSANLEPSAAMAALDIATALICSPIVGTSHSQTDWMHIPGNSARGTCMSLSEALKLEVENAAKITKTDSLMAETIIRLNRRVESQLAITITALPELTAPILPELGGLQSDTIMGTDMQPALDFAAVGVDAAALDLTGPDAMQMDLPTGLDDSLLGTGQVLEEDDIFGGLLNDDLDFGAF